jgi:putative inorganic carbon (HCO3(-)) transporter
LKKLPLVARWGTLILLIGITISTLSAGFRTEALGAVFAWFIVPMFFSAVIIASQVDITALIFGIVVGALIQTAYGLQLLPLQIEPRLLGTFASPNFYAAVVVPAIFLSFLLPMKGKWLPIVVLLWGLILSQSLGGMLGLLAGGLYLLFLFVKEKRMRLLLAGLLIVVGLIGGVIAHGRFANNSHSSLSSRQQIWNVAWRIGEQHPFTGVGLRNFDNVYFTEVTYVYPNPMEFNVPEPHNLYLAFWLDLSLVGLVGILLIIGGALAQGGIPVAVLIGLLAHGLVDTPIFKLELAVLFWLYMAVIFVFGKKEV